MNLKDLDLSTLTEQEQMMLYPFFDAYNRKYPPAMSWRDCRSEGLLPVEYTHCGLTEIQESLDELDTLSSFHLNEDGEVVILKHGREMKELGIIEFSAPVYASPVIANGVLYIASQTHLFAFKEGAKTASK